MDKEQSKKQNIFEKMLKPDYNNINPSWDKEDIGYVGKKPKKEVKE